MYITDIEQMHGQPGRFRVVYCSQAELDSTNPRKNLWKDDLSESEAKQEEIVCYRSMNCDLSTLSEYF
jgi:hypothetical protein